MKPREFWIEFGGDPSDDKEVYKRYCAAVPFKGTDFSDEVVHTVEYSAYDSLLAKLAERDKQIEAMKNGIIEAMGHLNVIRSGLSTDIKRVEFLTKQRAHEAYVELRVCLAAINSDGEALSKLNDKSEGGN